MLPQCTILCENQSIVNRLTTFQSHLPPFSPVTDFIADDDSFSSIMQQQPTNEHISVLASEWDILATIEDNTKLLAHQNAKVQFEFIPSHQDDDTSYDNLSPKAKSNVDADHLATQFQEDHIHDERNVLPMLPKAGVHLHLRN